MKRRLASLVHPMTTRLALLFLLVFPASCSKDQVPVAPNHTVSGSKSAPGMGPSADVSSQGILALAAGVDKNTFVATNSLVLVSEITVPAAGPYPETTYYLVETLDKSPFANKSFGSEVTLNLPHHTVWLPEDDVAAPDRDGLTFDDTDSWRTSTQYLSQPAIGKVGVLAARMVSEGSGSYIALFDTGADPAHPLFQSPKMKFYSGGNYLTFPPSTGTTELAGNGLDDDGDGVSDDGVGHGTYVAGLLYTCSRQASVRVYKVLDEEGRGTAFGLAKAIQAATTAGVHVLNLSLGLNADNRLVHHVIARAAALGIVTVASAGNLNSATGQFPAAYPEVISVAAVDRDDVKYERGNYGPTVDIAAPGVDVISTIPGLFGTNKYAVARGTSAAVPFVSGAIAMVRARNGGTVSPEDAATIVLGSTDDISTENPGIQLGSGRVDLGAASQTFIVGDPQE